MANVYFFLGILVVPLMGLDGARGPCPTPCRCSLEVLNCSRITNPPGIHQIPLPKLATHPHPFAYLDFTGNAITAIGKEVWEAYPFAESLVLKDNHLSRLDNSSLEGLLSLTYLDLSCNKIQIIERNVFEAVPFLQVINLTGNIIERIGEGTFQAWHRMQFLLKVDLSHNPLAVIEDPHFYRMPSLQLLDLGATRVTLRMLEELLLTSLPLRKLILPVKMSCCLCRMKGDTEVLWETIQLECTETCHLSASVCENEDPVNRMQEQVLKALEIRNPNSSSVLTILPEKIMELDKGTPKATVPNQPSSQESEKSTDEATGKSLKRDTSFEMARHVRKVQRVNWLRTDQKSKDTLLRLDRDKREWPDNMLSRGSYWKYKRTSFSPPQAVATQDDFYRLNDIFDADINKRLTSLIPNPPVRKLISHVIRILKMDCTVPTTHLACAKLISRTGLLLKLVSENIHEDSSVWKSYFWPSTNVSNMTTASSRNLEQPVDLTAGHGISDHRFTTKVVLAISLAPILMVIIVVIFLLEICSLRSPAKDTTFLGRKKKPQPDEERSTTASSQMDKPPPLKDQTLAEMRNIMVDKRHYEASSEAKEIFSWGSTRPSAPEPLVDKPSSVPTLEMMIPIIPPPGSPPPPRSAPSPQSSVNKASEAAGGTPKAPPLKAISSTADGGDDEDDEGLGGESESPTTEATSEAPESGEGDEDSEEEEESE